MEYEDKVRIATPEGVEIELAIAGIGSRLVARLIDVAIQAVLIALTVVATLGALDDSSLGGTIVAVVAIVGSFAVVWAYDTLWEAFGGGRSPGKRAAGLRVVGRSAEPETLSMAAVRNLLRLIDEYLTLWIVALVSMLRSEHGQRVGDHAAGTLVVKEARSPSAAPARPDPDPEGIERAERWDLSRLGPEDVAALNAFAERRGSLAPGPRARLAGSIAHALRPKVGGAPAYGADERFIDILLALIARRR